MYLHTGINQPPISFDNLSTYQTRSLFLDIKTIMLQSTMKLHLCIVLPTLLLLPLLLTDGLSTTNNKNSIDRRSFMGTVGAITPLTTLLTSPLPANSASTNNKSIQNKLENDILNLPSPSYASEFNGVDNTYFPSYLQGDWEVTQTLVDLKTPLGLKYLGGPNGDIAIAEKTLAQSRSKIDQPVTLRLRYIKTKWGVAEDRLYNSRSRLNAFAEKDVVASVVYADVGGSNRKSVLMLGGSEQDPLQTTIVYFKGPAAQKSFVVSHGGGPSQKVAANTESNSNAWIGYELQRSIFALTNTNTAPPVTTDTEYIWSFDLIDDNHVQGKLRIAGYLNAQNDKLYFDARNRAVSLQDYTLDMKRIL